ncbi:hypothetical protein O6H91_15G065100 [Diphasiastrum complanatum]|uniref:Uncharacterized protein n=1 Tax=Diphasiastrum complanatum TaxID=34168 RepID=A0ACC2BJ77_DIPCM|nr:hypothetical protein O6H91_15G065100 [Diphasiastrum complanatum]
MVFHFYISISIILTELLFSVLSLGNDISYTAILIEIYNKQAMTYTYFGAVADEHSQLRERFLIITIFIPYLDFLWTDSSFTICTFGLILTKSECYNFMFVQCFGRDIFYQLQRNEMIEADSRSHKFQTEKAEVKSTLIFKSLLFHVQCMTVTINKFLIWHSRNYQNSVQK